MVTHGCGIDVHQAEVVACLLIGPAGQAVRREVRRFATTPAGLVELRDWLRGEGVTHAAMESTGVYWRPVHAVLEDAVAVIVGNAQRIRNVPGRKTDVADAEWLAELLRHGLIAPSVVPDKPRRELRELLRFRHSLVATRTAERNRALKLLESAGLKLASVVSDVFGVSGLAMLRALAAGGQSATEIAGLARGRLRRKRGEIEQVLAAGLNETQRFLLELALQRLDALEQDLATLEARIAAALEPYGEAHQRLCTIPGVDWVVAAVLIAEIGVDMSVFGTAPRLAAWAGVAPGNRESGGKRYRAGARKGDVLLKTVLCNAATSAGRSRNTYLSDKYYRLKARRGARCATVAVAHKILIAAFHILAEGCTYRELGADYLDRRAKQRITSSLKRRLERLGYAVTLEIKQAA
jgi:transposase